MAHRTEEVYDTEMAPLVAKLIEIAKREKIPLLVSAGMLVVADHHGHVHEEPTACTCDTVLTYAVEKGVDPRLLGVENRLNLALNLIRGHSGFDTAAGLMISRYHPIPEKPMPETLNVMWHLDDPQPHIIVDEDTRNRPDWRSAIENIVKAKGFDLGIWDFMPDGRLRICVTVSKPDENRALEVPPVLPIPLLKADPHLKNQILDLIKGAFLDSGRTEFWPQQFAGPGGSDEVMFAQVLIALRELRAENILREHAVLTRGTTVLWEGPGADLYKHVGLVDPNDVSGVGIQFTFHLTDWTLRLLRIVLKAEQAEQKSQEGKPPAPALAPAANMAPPLPHSAWICLSIRHNKRTVTGAVVHRDQYPSCAGDILMGVAEFKGASQEDALKAAEDALRNEAFWGWTGELEEAAGALPRRVQRAGPPLPLNTVLRSWHTETFGDPTGKALLVSRNWAHLDGTDPRAIRIERESHGVLICTVTLPDGAEIEDFHHDFDGSSDSLGLAKARCMAVLLTWIAKRENMREAIIQIVKPRFPAAPRWRHKVTGDQYVIEGYPKLLLSKGEHRDEQFAIRYTRIDDGVLGIEEFARPLDVFEASMILIPNQMEIG